MLLALIVASEIGFWVFLGAGLAARYLLRWRRVSTVLLTAVPLIDVVLLVATIIDLRRGAEPEWGHGLAALYIGFSVAFGKSLIRWADQRFAHRFADGPAPWKPPKYGRAKLRYEWVSFGRAMLGWAVAAALLGGGYLLVGDHERAEPLLVWMTRPATPMLIWFVFWPLWETLFPSKPPKQTADTNQAGPKEQTPLERMKDLLGR
jgi:hypothetical protein